MDETNLLRSNLRWLLARSGQSARAVSLAVSKKISGVENDSLLKTFLQGRVRSPGIRTVKGFAEYFGVTVEDLTSHDLSAILETELATGLTQPLRTRNHLVESEARRIEGAHIPIISELPRDVPILGTAVGGSGGSEFVFNGETVGWARHPPAMAAMKNVFAIFIRGDSMRPLFEPGRLAYVSQDQPPNPGDYVLVELEPEEGETTGAAFLKQLVRRTGKAVFLRQLNPPKDLPEIPVSRIRHLYLVPHPLDLIGD